jgi:hypothetical protein
MANRLKQAFVVILEASTAPLDVNVSEKRETPLTMHCQAQLDLDFAQHQLCRAKHQQFD